MFWDGRKRFRQGQHGAAVGCCGLWRGYGVPRGVVAWYGSTGRYAVPALQYLKMWKVNFQYREFALPIFEILCAVVVESQYLKSLNAFTGVPNF